MGEPSPPVPTQRTLAAFSLRWPSMPTSGRIRWREYRARSSVVSSGRAVGGVIVAMISGISFQVSVPAGDGRDDGERVGRTDLGGFLRRKIAHVLVVQVQVNKGAQLALAGEQVAAQFGMMI